MPERVTKGAKTEIREQRGGFLKTLVGTLGSTCYEIFYQGKEL